MPTPPTSPLGTSTNIWQQAQDGAALLMLVLILFILSAFALFFIVLARRARRAQNPEQKLLDEVGEQSKKKVASRGQHGKKPAPPPAEPWHKEPDWWKKP